MGARRWSSELRLAWLDAYPTGGSRREGFVIDNRADCTNDDYTGSGLTRECPGSPTWSSQLPKL